MSSNRYYIVVYTFMLNDHVDLLEPFLAGQTFNPRFHIGGFRILCVYPHHQSDGFSTKMRALHLLFSKSPKMFGLDVVWFIRFQEKSNEKPLGTHFSC